MGRVVSVKAALNPWERITLPIGLDDGWASERPLCKPRSNGTTILKIVSKTATQKICWTLSTEIILHIRFKDLTRFPPLSW